LAVIVVRYFGGTLLGVPGLTKAYKSAAALALQTVAVIRKPIEERYSLQFDPARINDVMRIVKEIKCRVIEQEILLFCRLILAVPKSREAEFHYKFEGLKNIELTRLA
jgi:putative IMPACT (imprinted ancient) family translation regulator